MIDGTGTETTHGNKLLQLIFIGLFCLFTVMPVVFFSTASESGGETMLRSEKEVAGFSVGRLVQRFQSLKEDFNDNFGFRSYLVSVYNFVNYKLQINGNEKVLSGADGWLFLNTSALMEDILGQNVFTNDELEQWRRYMTIKHRALKDRGVEYVFVMAPNKHVIHRDRLPGRFRPVQGNTRADQWYRFMEAHTEVPIVNLTEFMKRAGKTIPCYSATDTHWNEYGAAICQESVVDVLNDGGLEFQVKRYEPDSFKMVEKIGGDLARMMNLRSYFSGLEPVHKGDRRYGVNRPVLRNNTLFAREERVFERGAAQTELRCLLIGDSFVNVLNLDMLEYFRHVMVVRLHNHQQRHLDPFVHYINEFKPDVVIEVLVTRNYKDLVPEDPPDINFHAYPQWLKRHFSVTPDDPVSIQVKPRLVTPKALNPQAVNTQPVMPREVKPQVVKPQVVKPQPGLLRALGE